MELTGCNIVGCSLNGRGNTTFTAVTPQTGGELCPSFYEAPPEVIGAAVNAGAEAFAGFSRMSPRKRAEFLEAIAGKIELLGSTLIDRCHQETGLPEKRLEAERGRTVNQIRMFADLLREGSWVEARIDTALPERTPVPRPDIRQMLKPMGPVAVFGAGNFPLAFSVAGGDTASALASGCPVIVKAHPAHPGTSELTGMAIVEAAQGTGMPEGVFSLLHGATPETGIRLVRHPGITAVAFTGSYKAGMTLRDAVNRRDVPIPLFAEMGSVNPVFLLPGALEDRKGEIAEGLAASVTLGAGQFCTNPGLVFLKRSSGGDAFIHLLRNCLLETPPEIMLTPATCSSYRDALKVRREITGVQTFWSTLDSPHGLYGPPALFETSLEVFLSNPILRKEAFGPCTVIVWVESGEDLNLAADVIQGELTVSFHGTERDIQEYRNLVEKMTLKAGRIIINGFPTGVEVCPAMHHGGPFPAALDPRATSVGTLAIRRFCRPVCYQDAPEELLPAELKDGNPWNILRLVNGKWAYNATFLLHNH